jgi:hypothetical protein
VLSPNNLGDLSLHLTYIRYLASGVPFWPENPIATGATLTYPIGVDLFHSLLLLLGLDVWRGFVWIGLIGSALTGAALWRWGRGFTVFGFLANGGFFAMAIFFTWQLQDFQKDFAWKSFALSLLATQRGLLFAFPAGLFLLSSWRARFFGGEGSPLPRWGEVLLYASLPLFHFHTFLFLSVLLATWFLIQPPARRDLLLLVGASFVPATILVWFITGGLHGGRMLGWKIGWMWDDEPFLNWCREGFGDPVRLRAALLFWPLNFGVLPIFVISLVVILWRERPAYFAGSIKRVLEALFMVSDEREPEPGRRANGVWPSAVVFPSLFVFLVCCFVKFAPWEWDNTKLMVWSYLAILPFLWSELLLRCPVWSRYCACVLLFGSGFLSTLGGIDSTPRGYFIASRSELDGTAYALREIPVTERIAGAPTYNHPLLLCGRKMVLGYLGHVSSHGLDWQTPSLKLESLMQGDENWRALAEELHARYLFWGRAEEEAYPNSTQPWKDEVQRVAFGDWGALYDLKTPRDKAKPAVAE